MIQRRILLLSSSAGAGRSTLAANLAAVLSKTAPLKLLETRSTGPSDLALHLGQVPASLAEGLRELEGFQGWVLVDGASLGQPDWIELLALCGSALLVEKADLQGCRRLPRLLKELQELGLPHSSMALAWMGAQAVQPLPPVPGIATAELPWDPKACERMSQSRLWALDEPQGPFAKRCLELARSLETLQPSKLRLPAAAAAPAPSVLMDEDPQELALIQRLSVSLRQALDSRSAPDDAAATAEAQRLLASEKAPWLTPEIRQRLARRLVQDLLGLGPLEDLLADPAVSEIMVNHASQVYAERAGRLSLTPSRFRDEAHLRTVIERIVWPLGRRIDESSPRVDARLPDGSRVNAVIPPLAIKGSCLTIRKFPERRLGMEELVQRGSLDARSAEFLHLAVLHKRNILVSGGTGSGKTTLLNALSSYIPEGERIITIEDAAELKLQQPHVVTLESRPANLEGQGSVNIRDLVMNALRMRPDRIIVGECRGGEALDMLQAMNTGHEGSLSTIHANSPRDALQRLETLCLMSGLDLPLRVVRQQVASAIDLVLQIGRLRDGSRRVLAITELTGLEGDVVSSQDLFVWKPQTGRHEATGVPAKFFRELQEDGEAVDFGLFQPVFGTGR